MTLYENIYWQPKTEVHLFFTLVTTHKTHFCSSQSALVWDVLVPYSVFDSDMTAVFYDSLIFPYSDSKGMERAAKNHGKESLSSVTLRLSLLHVKIDNHQNLMESRERERKTETGRERERTDLDKKGRTTVFLRSWGYFFLDEIASVSFS